MTENDDVEAGRTGTERGVSEDRRVSAEADPMIWEREARPLRPRSRPSVGPDPTAPAFTRVPGSDLAPDGSRHEEHAASMEHARI